MIQLTYDPKTNAGLLFDGEDGIYAYVMTPGMTTTDQPSRMLLPGTGQGTVMKDDTLALLIERAYFRERRGRR